MPRVMLLDYLLATYQTSEAHDPGWLFSTVHGYGQISIRTNGVNKARRVHAYVCELVHGPPPRPDLVARHSCPHNRACFYAGHLSWGTRGQNAADRAIHDFDLPLPTQTCFDLTDVDWQRIRMLRALGTTIPALSRVWEISVEDVRLILSRTCMPTSSSARVLEPWPGD